MNQIVKMEIWQFSLVYLLLLIVIFIMKKCKIDQSKFLCIASFRMTIQLIIAGLVLTYIFKNPKKIFTVLYIASMCIFATYRVISKNKGINKKFKMHIFISLVVPPLLILTFFIKVVVSESLFNPQYMIPIGGMVIGNSMNGVSLAIKSFRESFDGQKNKIDSLVNIGVAPEKIFLPFVNKSLETALLPNMNNMLGMGIISLPGLMTGQILSGTLPTTAILYQISIMIVIITSTCLSVFYSLHMGYKTLINSKNQINFY